MGLSRSGTLFLIGLLVLVALSLHPVASVETIVRGAFAPARLVSELSWPLAWLARGEVAAAESEAAAAFASDRERSHALLFASQAAALPVDPALRVNRAAVAAHVIDHSALHPDLLRLRFAVEAGVVAGSPVVCGDVFVGRVLELDPEHAGECLAELVTAKDFRVSAEASGPSGTSRCVVGGVLGKPRREERTFHLAVQFPSDRTVATGSVRVSESPDASMARLADGFVLGELVSVDLRGTRLLGIRPPLDYAFGLNHLAILVAPERGTAGPVLPVDPFDPEAWIQTRVLLTGDPSASRETRHVTLTSSDGVAPGAALSIGGRFVGRVERVGALDSDVRLLADPGFCFTALAKLPAHATPLALGRLVSLGHSGADEVRFECDARVPLSLTNGEDVEVEIWTGAAEPDLPPGLLVGTGRIRSTDHPFEIRVRPSSDARMARRLHVWRGRGNETEDDS